MDRLRAYCGCFMASLLAMFVQGAPVLATDDAFSVCARLVTRGLMRRLGAQGSAPAKRRVCQTNRLPPGRSITPNGVTSATAGPCRLDVSCRRAQSDSIHEDISRQSATGICCSAARSLP